MSAVDDRPTAYAGPNMSRRNPVLTSAFRKGHTPANKGLKLPPEIYTPEEIGQLLRHCGRGPGAIRHKAMIALQARSGMRAAEMLSLRLSAINFEVGYITVDGKGRKRRLVHLDEMTAALLRAWIDGPRARLNLPRGAPVFCTYEKANYGRPVRYAQYADTLKRAGRRAGIEKRVHTHGLRHSAAFQALLEGRDLEMIQQLLGHESLATTQRYVKHRLPLAMIRELQARAWPAAMLDALNGHSNGVAPRNSSASPAPAALPIG